MKNEFSKIVDELIEGVPSVTITQARYAELLVAEHDANALKAMIFRRAENYQSMNYDEIRLLSSLYFPYEETKERVTENVTE